MTPPSPDKGLREAVALTYEEAEKLALQAIHGADGRGMIGRGRNHLHQRVARAILQAHRAALPALSVPEGWRPIETAPRDGTYVLALIGGADGHWAHLNGRAFVIRHEGKTPSGFDLGWALFPGFGGVGDHWLAGWMPLPTLSAIPSWGSSRPWPIDGTGNLGSAVASGDAGDATTEGGGA